jgi:hypothetical protein
VSDTNNQRPEYQHGLGTVGGSQFHWGSGTPGKYWSIPYGDYPVTPNAPTGAWAHQAGAIPIANNVIPDPQLGRNRIGIMIHSGSSDNLDQLYTQGCFKVAPQEWPAVRSEILKEASNGPLYLHVAPGGVAAFTNTKTFSQAGDQTPAANANAIAATTAAPSRVATPTPIPDGNSHADFIHNYASQIGVDPNLALGIANAEGLRAWSSSNPNASSTVDIDKSTGKPFSFGDFQLNIHPGAMGAQALAAGIDPRDPNQWQAADKFALDQMKAGGVKPWSGDPVAKAYLASGQVAPAPVTPGTTINTTTPAAAPAAAVADGKDGQPTELDKGVASLTKAFGGDGGGGKPPPPPPPMQFMPDPRQQTIAMQAQALAAQTGQNAARPLTWGSGPLSLAGARPPGQSMAYMGGQAIPMPGFMQPAYMGGQYMPMPGTTLNSMGGQYV